ncbi:MAG: I78 family peptidase inhibitor [Pseudomonadota bacterium]
MLRTLLFAGLSTLLLAACSAPEAVDTQPDAERQVEFLPDPAPAPGDTSDLADAEETLVQPEWDALDRVQDSCGLAAVRGFLGQAAEDIPENRLPPVYRILAPTDQATMDYLPRRLNVLTDEAGDIIGFKCG